MVEVFDFQKNFTTGKEIRKSKFKDNAMTKGVATIELFDKDNNLIEKTVSNNFINNIMDSSLMYKIISRVLEGNTYELSKIVSTEQFGQIQLRNGDFDEDPNTIFMRGDIVGWAERTVTDGGTDIKKGSYNANESYTEYTNDGYYHAHLVYDFATSKANGTINHVYWTPKIKNSGKIARACLSDLHIKPTGSVPSTISVSGKGQFMFDAKGRLVNKLNSSYYEVSNKYRFLQGFEEAKIDKENPIEYIGQECRIDDNRYIEFSTSYTAGNNTSSRKAIINLKLKNSKTDEVEKDVTFNLLDFETIKKYSDKNTSYGYIDVKEIKTCTESGNVYMKMYFYNSQYVLPEVNADGSVVEEQYQYRDYIIAYNILQDAWTIQPDPSNYICYSLNDKFYRSISLKLDDNKFMLLHSYSAESYITMFDERDFSTEKITYEHYYNGLYSGGYNNYLNFMGGIDFNSYISISQDSSYSIHIDKFLPYTSHTKLPSPVTKTNTTTMKITYDYYIQVPNLFAPKGKEFEWGQE